MRNHSGFTNGGESLAVSCLCRGHERTYTSRSGVPVRMSNEPEEKREPDWKLALLLHEKACADTASVGNYLLEQAQKEANEQRTRAKVAENDLWVVRRLQAMLMEPRYARRLMGILLAGEPEDE